MNILSRGQRRKTSTSTSGGPPGSLPLPGATRLSLQWQVGLILLAGLLLLFALFALLGRQLSEENARTMAAERLNVARLSVLLLDQLFNGQFDELEMTADRLAASGIDGQQPDLLRRSGQLVVGLTVVDASGKVAWSEPASNGQPGTDWAAQPSFQVPMSTGGRYASGVLPNSRGGRIAKVLFAVPIGRQQAPRGVLVAELDVTNRLSPVLLAAAQELGTSGHAELVDQNLQLIGSNEAGHVLGPAEHPSYYGPLLATHTSAVGLTDPIGDEDPADRGQRHVMAFVPLNTVPWGLGLGGSESVFTTTADRWRGEAIQFGELGLLIALFLVWITRRGVVKPLRALTLRSTRIAAGDLATPVPLQGEGEVGGLAEALEEMRRRLLQVHAAEERVSLLKDEFLATASHELRSPLTALSMLVQMELARAARGQAVDAAEALTDVRLHVDRLIRLVGGLLETSRIETGKLELECEQLDVSELAREVIHLARASAGTRRLVVDAPESIVTTIDHLRLGQVLTNLIDNALKFSPQAGTVRLEVGRTERGLVQIAVQDEGPGIPLGEQDRVFDRFYQTHSRSSSGLGLGLYICRRIVELHGGEIHIESPAGGGARFVISLPGA